MDMRITKRELERKALVEIANRFLDDAVDEFHEWGWSPETACTLLTVFAAECAGEGHPGGTVKLKRAFEEVIAEWKSLWDTWDLDEVTRSRIITAWVDYHSPEDLDENRPEGLPADLVENLTELTRCLFRREDGIKTLTDGDLSKEHCGILFEAFVTANRQNRDALEQAIALLHNATEEEWSWLIIAFFCNLLGDGDASSAHEVIWMLDQCLKYSFVITDWLRAAVDDLPGLEPDSLILVRIVTARRILGESTAPQAAWAELKERADLGSNALDDIIEADAGDEIADEVLLISEHGWEEWKDHR